MKKVALIQARMGSSRFPGKVLERLADRPVLDWVVQAAQAIPAIDEVMVLTSDQPADTAIAKWCHTAGVGCFRGSEKDVLSRYYQAACQLKADVVVRITADCPLLDAHIVGQVLHLVAGGYVDYASNTAPSTWPDGLDCEAMTMQALTVAHEQADRPSDREHVTPYIRRHQQQFKAGTVTASIPGLQWHRWTIDVPEDLVFVNELVAHSKPQATTFDYLETLKRYPQLQQPDYLRNVYALQGRQHEHVPCEDFTRSQQMLSQALQTIPLGSQTFSKAHMQYPEKSAPLFLTHGQGGLVWDVDGHEYVDMVSGLMPNILGYNDLEVNFAIQSQLNKGITFSMATELEMQLAERLCRLIPCAEKVRFAKNGTDVTSAAIRLARAFTGRDAVMVCGYHGWQDWYIGTTTRDKGVPKAVSALSTTVPYNDLDRLESLLKQQSFAALIMEPCNVTPPKPGYLSGVKALCEQYGTVLVFDEVITGFRYALGGAQAYFGVTPHLACFGKALGNGMPISAIVGRSDIMQCMEEIFFSSTFGGETLSIAAAIATIDKIEQQDVVSHLWRVGAEIGQEVNLLLSQFSLTEVISLVGLPPWHMLQFKVHMHASAQVIRTLFMQEMIRHGVLIASSFNVNFAQDDYCQQRTLYALKQSFECIAHGLQSKTIIAQLKSNPVMPIFAVR